MPNNKLGSWANPPLAYVVAEVAISPHYTVARSIPAIQEELRDEYPRTVEGSEIVLELVGANSAPTPQSVWQLLADDGRRGIQIGTRAISLHATHYPNFPAFADWLGAVLQVIGKSALNPFVERVGLRYVDYILPSEGHEPADYLAPALRGVVPEGTTGPTRTSMWVASFPFDVSTVNTRVAAPAAARGQIVLPPNFSALPLTRPDTMTKAEAMARGGLPFGFIDTDCTESVGLRFDPDALVARFSKMHDCVSRTFKAFMSDLAVQEWK